MNIDAGFLFFHLPNFALAALTYTVIGRYILSLFFRPDSDLVIWRVFCQITNPVLKAVRYVTPQAVPSPMLMLLTIVWLMLLRVILFFVTRSMGLLPTAGA